MFLCCVSLLLCAITNRLVLGYVFLCDCLFDFLVVHCWCFHQWSIQIDSVDELFHSFFCFALEEPDGVTKSVLWHDDFDSELCCCLFECLPVCAMLWRVRTTPTRVSAAKKPRWSGRPSLMLQLLVKRSLCMLIMASARTPGSVVWWLLSKHKDVYQDQR